jgi:hypothetical protein
MNTKVIAVLVATLPLVAVGQIGYNGGVYTQNFDTLKSGAIFTTYTNFPTGWTVSSAFNPGTYVWTTVTNGFSNNYGKYCFSSTTNDPDKSIGLVIGTTGPAYLGARFRNTSGVILRAFTLSYFAEQWRKGAISSNDQTIPFSYSLVAFSLTNGTFVNVPALAMHSVHDGDGVAAAMNGNAISNRQWVSGTVSNLMWFPGQDLWIRWSGVGYSFFEAHALAIDDLSFRAVPELHISSASPGRLRFSWATNYPGYSLQSAVTPTATSWEAVTNAPATSGSELSVEIEATDTQRFFRLKMQ